jgi:hypothetical protein
LGDLAKDDLFNLRNPDLVQKPLSAGQKAPLFEATTTAGKAVTTESPTCTTLGSKTAMNTAASRLHL